MNTHSEQTKAPGIKVAVLASAGSALEWYDFFIYGTAAALIFPHIFFPADLPPFVAQIASFSTFTVGFIARPIGGMLFGHFGDLKGRKNALVIAMFLMGISTTLIGFLPSYASIGIFAPLLLVLLRFIQGLAVGGQWGGAALLAIESAPPGQRGFYGSFVQIGVPIGVVLANLVFLFLSMMTTEESFMAWGWRVGFIISIFLIFIGAAIHFKVAEPIQDTLEDNADGLVADNTIQDVETDTKDRSPLIEVMVNHWREILLAGGAFVANNTCFYIAITFALAYGTTELNIDRDLILWMIMAASLLMVPTLLGCGALSDKYGRRGIFLLGALLSGIWAFAFFPLLESSSSSLIFIAIAGTLIFVSMMYGPQAALFAELFPKSVRYSGASLGYQIGAVIGGGFAPIIATTLFVHYQSSFPIAIYLAMMCVISFVCVLLLGVRARKQ